MLRQLIAGIVVLLNCDLTVAQWSSFKPVTEDLIPEDQRDISEQTVVKGKVVPKEIRVDWYGFTLNGDTNIVKDRFQYPVSDPTLAPGDSIIKVQSKEVKNADEVDSELRGSPDKALLSITVERMIDGEVKPVKILLHRAKSLILKGIFERKVKLYPPVFNSEKVGVWGGVHEINLSLTGIADNGEMICHGRMSFANARVNELKNIVLRGWNLKIPKIGQPVQLPLPDKAPNNQPFPAAQAITLLSGSTGVPNNKSDGGAGFTVTPSTYLNRDVQYIIGIGSKEKLKVDGKDLQVLVLINME